MKTKLIILFALFTMLQSNGQNCNVPPPIGLYNVYSIDPDNDGYTVFDMAYYIEYFDRPIQESIFSVSSSGYNFVFGTTGNQPLPLMYTNTSLMEICRIRHEYTGSGPTFNPLPPCYWPLLFASEVQLMAVNGSADKDSDGILNVNEDTNNNLNLMDDDEDGDGIINLNDPVNNLALTDNHKIILNVYPNPVTRGIVTFESETTITSVIIYDLSGKQLSESKMVSYELSVNQLAAGIYFLKFQSEQGAVFKKIIIN